MFAPGSPEPTSPEQQQIPRAPGLRFFQTHTEPFSHSYFWGYFFYYYYFYHRLFQVSVAIFLLLQLKGFLLLFFVINSF